MLNVASRQGKGSERAGAGGALTGVKVGHLTRSTSPGCSMLL